MKAQFKYALRQSLALRGTALAATVVLNLVFGALGYFNFLREPIMITAVTLSSFALCGILVVNIIADIETFKCIYNTPNGYLYALTPVPSWKILLARTVSIVLQDIAALIVGIFGVVWQALVLSGELGFGKDYSNYGGGGSITDIIFGGGIILLGYAYIIMLIVFGLSVKNSVFFGIPGRSLLALLCVAVVAWVFNLLNFVLVPFGTFDRWKMFFSISLSYGLNAGTILWGLLTLAKIAALFAAGSILMERKNNL